MMMSALEGGLCFQKGLGAVHTLSHALGALGTPVLHHGTLNGVLLPAVLRFNESACTEKYVRIRAALGLSPDRDLATVLLEMQRKIGLVTRLRDLGITRDILPKIAREAMHDLSHVTNPRRASEQDYLELLSESF